MSIFFPMQLIFLLEMLLVIFGPFIPYSKFTIKPLLIDEVTIVINTSLPGNSRGPALPNLKIYTKLSPHLDWFRIQNKTPTALIFRCFLFEENLHLIAYQMQQLQFNYY